MRYIVSALHFIEKKRSKGTFKNELEDIPGIGKATADLLLKKFRSVNNIRRQPEEELEKLIGKSKTRVIKEYFNKNKE